ncbi:hypothetical protein [Pseudomonas protegens]
MGDFNRRIVGIFKAIPGRHGARNIGDLNTDGSVLVAPFDADWVLHYGSPLTGWLDEQLATGAPKSLNNEISVLNFVHNSTENIKNDERLFYRM